jgi:pimeloyl-ACP methyl ester carboxylesterase
MSGQPGAGSDDALGPEALLSADEPEAQKRLDDLVDAFEVDMRHRPTPMEMDEDDSAGKGKSKRRRVAGPAGATATPAEAAPVGIEMAPGLANADAIAAAAPVSAEAAAESPMLPFDAAPIPAEVPPVAASQPAAVPEPVPAAVEAAAATGGAARADFEGAASGIEGWWAAGERVRVELPAGTGYQIFTRTAGKGPWLTLLHGFPTSSYDWAPVVEALSRKYRLLMFDLLGFGDSDKPAGHNWSAFEQADIVEALWRHFGVEQTRILAHDVGDTVTLELIARRQEGTLATGLQQVTMLNGGVYSGFHRPRPVQVWLQRPLVGAFVARMLSERRFGPALAEVFGADHQPAPEEVHQHWLSVARRNGGRNYHRLIKYIPERRAQAQRWEAALDSTDIPIKFVWGMADPVSGAHMAEVIRDRRRDADIVELATVGHYPQLEAPSEVARAVLA